MPHGSRRVGVRLMGNPGHNRVVTCSDVLACLEGFSQENWEDITNLFTAITEHLGDLTQAQWEAITNLFLAVGGYLEGDYSTWAITGRYDTGVGIDAVNDRIWIRNNGTVIWYDHSAPSLNLIDKDGTLVSSGDGNVIPVSASVAHLPINPYSILRKYLVYVSRTDGTYLRMLKDDTFEVWDRDVTDDQSPYTLDSEPFVALSISPNGKYFAVLLKEATTSNGLIFIYEGS